MSKYLTVVGAILSSSVNSTISTTKDIGYLFERTLTNDDRYFIVIDPDFISKNNQYYSTLTISLSISEEDFEFSKVAGSDGVHENCIVEAPGNVPPCLPLEPCSNYGSYQCNNSLFRFKTFKPVSTNILLNDGTSIKTFEGYDSVSGCVANVTSNEVNSITTNIENLHHSLNIAGNVDVRQYVINAETLKDTCDNIHPGIILSDSDGNVWYSRSGFDKFDTSKIDGSISTTSAPSSSNKKTSLPASTNTTSYSKVNQTSLGLQPLFRDNHTNMQSSVKPPCDCGN